MAESKEVVKGCCPAFETRMMVVLFLTVLYPSFLAAFYCLFIFFIIPVMARDHYDYPVFFKTLHTDFWLHAYWLVFALLWLLLLVIILPFMGDKEKIRRSKDPACIVEESPIYHTTVHTVQPQEKEGSEGKPEDNRKSRSSSRDSTEKLNYDKRDSQGRSQETLTEREKLCRSGEFLSECIGNLGGQEEKVEVVELKLHRQSSTQTGTEPEKSDEPDVRKSASSSSSSSDDQKKDGSSSSSEDEAEKGKKRKESSSSSSSDEPDQPIKEGKVDVVADVHETPEMGVVEEEIQPVRREKATPTIDTSRASGYYECSMPTPKLSTPDKQQSNRVFLFVNPKDEGEEPKVEFETIVETDDNVQPV